MNPFSLRPLLLACLLILALPAWALNLDEAKHQGLVGEQADGYLGIVTSAPSAEVRSWWKGSIASARPCTPRRRARRG